MCVCKRWLVFKLLAPVTHVSWPKLPARQRQSLNPKSKPNRYIGLCLPHTFLLDLWNLVSTVHKLNLVSSSTDKFMLMVSRHMSLVQPSTVCDRPVSAGIHLVSMIFIPTMLNFTFIDQGMERIKKWTPKQIETTLLYRYIFYKRDPVRSRLICIIVWIVHWRQWTCYLHKISAKALFGFFLFKS